MKRGQLEQIIQEELELALQEKYTSAGTVPRIHKRKMTPTQIKKRESIGKKILAAIKTGGDKNPLRRAFKRWAQDNDHPINSEDKMNSYAWAMASDFAIGNKPFPPKFTKKKKISKGKKTSKRK